MNKMKLNQYHEVKNEEFCFIRFNQKNKRVITFGGSLYELLKQIKLANKLGHKYIIISEKERKELKINDIENDYQYYIDQLTQKAISGDKEMIKKSSQTT